MADDFAAEVEELFAKCIKLGEEYLELVRENKVRTGQIKLHKKEVSKPMLSLQSAD